jgi:DNA (cytosine-5)-methyltransferase 1
MYKPLTENLGEELLTLYLEAFHAKTYLPLGGGAGIDGERSGMWREMARIICEVQPRFVFVENSPMLTSRGLGRVLGDLAAMGFDARWGVLGAADVGANHQRDRIWIVGKQRTLAHTLSARQRRDKWQSQNEKNVSRQMADTDLSHGKRKGQSIGIQKGFTRIGDSSSMVSDSSSLRQSGQGQYEQSINPKTHKNWQTNYVESIGRSEQWSIEPNVGRVVDGVASRVDRLKAIGNGQVPLCAATAWRILNDF